jgi:hypothetical protein
MAREIRDIQDYKDKLLKLIPSEIVAAYMILQGIIPEDSSRIGTLVVGIALTILTPVYLNRIHNVKRTVQLVLTTISFIVWLYTLGGPFRAWGIYQAWIGSVILIIWTLIIPLFIRAQQGNEN